MLDLPLIESKIARPLLRTDVLERPRVTAALERAAKAGVVLVSAPTGYGKTVAVSAWLRNRPAAWVSVDEDDNDPLRLWRYAAAALGADLASGPLEANIDALAELDVPLVLEDVHVLTDRRCLATLAHATRVMPRLVLISRRDPPIRIARLRVQGGLGEVRAETLAFSTEEAAYVLGGGDATAITERTEGWPAAIYLVALWLRNGGNPNTLPRHHLSELVTTEVLAGLEADLHDFLVRTSVLPRLSAPLCDHVLEIDDAAQCLQRLLDANLFLVALDDDAGWFRYHPLFRELVRRELPDPAPLHRRAAAWYDAHGHPEEAVEHARAGGDHALAADLVDRHHIALTRTGRTATLLRWVRELPESELADRPVTLLAAAAAAGATGRPPFEVERLLAASQRAREARPDAWTPFHETMAAITAALARDENVPAALAAAESAVEHADDDLAVGALATLAAMQLDTGDEPLARRTCARALMHPTAERRPHGFASALSTLAITEVAAGRLPAAREHADQALAVVRSMGNIDSRIDARAHAADAIVARAEGRLGRAVRAAEAALKLHPRGAFRARILLELAQIRAARGELGRAETTLDEARTLIADCEDAGGMPALAERVAGSLGAGTLGAPAEPLSPAEELILLQLPTSRSNTEIAADLFLSPNTVKTHLKAIYRKLGAHSRTEAVHRATALGLLKNS
ncbi:LuxR C-terminal-related transcriptional regulator [Solirubrobacter phytolaccae]|nr:LuxR C-terminal-related transcriptional regulator [Solirubrobacter phytolaccae]